VVGGTGPTYKVVGLTCKVGVDGSCMSCGLGRVGGTHMSCGGDDGWDPDVRFGWAGPTI
jgi:hypothetical protein